MKKLLSSVLVVLVFTFFTLPISGCSAATVISEINIILTEATNILVVADPGATWVPELQSSITALKTAESSWQAGGPVTDVIDGLNTVELITAAIPLTARYSPLVDVLVAGIEAVLTALPQPAGLPVKLAYVPNPHIGRVKLVHHAFHDPSKEFAVAWNEAAVNAGLPGAVIK